MAKKSTVEKTQENGEFVVRLIVTTAEPLEAVIRKAAVLKAIKMIADGEPGEYEEVRERVQEQIRAGFNKFFIEGGFADVVVDINAGTATIRPRP